MDEDQESRGMVGGEADFVTMQCVPNVYLTGELECVMKVTNTSWLPMT